MDQRDQFAMAAVQGLLASDSIGFDGATATYWKNGKLDAGSLARDAYSVADAMLKARGPKRPIPVPGPGTVRT